ncbi:RNA polymerase archaeal subunit P/eukaryotic subunit RPABC4 [Trypanosoma melophagium]|uniref:RNA polymerase archaeal subunit P/eukaryotic subunit RPABC4 n=1 Tax=Trypanosoma melophagium TaxID=715481 RepID=UPI00351A1D18|nr:RNA polymerase archaeal subunit P/eukaryotic subunit RPABC4 [Trypanosoma melophagium]
MFSYPVKEEHKEDIKLSVPDDASEATKALQDTMTLYTCANCTRVVALGPSSQLMCTHCVHRTGSSTVFYKMRTQPTTYDTI